MPSEPKPSTWHLRLRWVICRFFVPLPPGWLGRREGCPIRRGWQRLAPAAGRELDIMFSPRGGRRQPRRVPRMDVRAAVRERLKMRSLGCAGEPFSTGVGVHGRMAMRLSNDPSSSVACVVSAYWVHCSGGRVSCLAMLLEMPYLYSKLSLGLVGSSQQGRSLLARCARTGPISPRLLRNTSPGDDGGSLEGSMRHEPCAEVV